MIYQNMASKDADEIIDPSNGKEILKDDQIKMLLIAGFEGNTTVAREVYPLLKQFINCAVTECIERAMDLAVKEGSDTIKVEHVEKSINQIVWDFP